MDMSGKVALITGAGSGLGAASAKRLAAAGAKVALLDIDESDLKKVAADIGQDALVIVADVSEEEAMKNAYQQVADTFSRLDAVFANAGINGVWAPLDELMLEEWHRTLNINLTGTFLTVKHALPLLKKRGGSVVITASVNGTRTFSNTGATAYSCSKAGQVAFMQMTALELAKHRIRVNAICPGAISTDISESTTKRDLETVKEPAEYPEGEIPLTDGQPGSAEQVADLVLFLASDASKHISGTPVWIDGAQSLLQG